jgi:hypothetical protein
MPRRTDGGLPARDGPMNQSRYVYYILNNVIVPRGSLRVNESISQASNTVLEVDLGVFLTACKPEALFTSALEFLSSILH